MYSLRALLRPRYQLCIRSSLPARCIRLLSYNIPARTLTLRSRPPTVQPQRNFSAIPDRANTDTDSTDTRQHLIEEETLPSYDANNFLPVRIGDVLNSKYRVVAKLGYGTTSTVWLCRDISTDVYNTIKICIAGEDARNEIDVSNHIISIQAEHPGQAKLRVIADTFEVIGPIGKHRCLVFEPLGLSMSALRKRFPEGGLNKTLLQQSLLLILLGLDFLHQVGVVHTDVSPNNILLGAADRSVYRAIEEQDHPVIFREGSSDTRLIYKSVVMPVTNGAPIICDFGCARLGEPGENFRGDVMPNFYRAPEVILGMPWDAKIDIWSVGLLIWDLFEGGRLFYAIKDGSLDDDQHLAEMVAMLGPPPREFLARSEKCQKFWDAEGRWIGRAAIPPHTLDSREHRLTGEDKNLLLSLARKILRWLPEERPNAEDLYRDPFLTQYEREEVR